MRGAQAEPSPEDTAQCVRVPPLSVGWRPCCHAWGRRRLSGPPGSAGRLGEWPIGRTERAAVPPAGRPITIEPTPCRAVHLAPCPRPRLLLRLGLFSCRACPLAAPATPPPTAASADDARRAGRESRRLATRKLARGLVASESATCCQTLGAAWERARAGARQQRRPPVA